MNPQECYNKWAATYDSVENVTRDMDGHATKQMLTKYSFSKVLELGCGTGKNTAWLTTVADNIWSVDLSDNMLARAKAKIQSKKVSFHKADITKPLELKDLKVDMVMCNLTMEHIEDIVPVFENAAAALNKNGLFFISEYHPFRQYLGKQARFENEGELVLIPAFVHHMTDYLSAAENVDLKLLELKEWFDEDRENGAPRLLTCVFQK